MQNLHIQTFQLSLMSSVVYCIRFFHHFCGVLKSTSYISFSQNSPRKLIKQLYKLWMAIKNGIKASLLIPETA